MITQERLQEFLAALEPGAQLGWDAAEGVYSRVEMASIASTAISLKRIADSLHKEIYGEERGRS